MFKKYSTKVYTNGEEYRDIISKAEWRMHFIGIRQY